MKKLITVVTSIVLMVSAVHAADTALDKKQVDSLTDSDRAKIESILKSNRLLKDNQSITKSSELKGFLGLPDIKIPDIKKELCMAACDASLGAALVACGGLSAGTAIAVCSAAAVVARDACKNGC